MDCVCSTDKNLSFQVKIQIKTQILENFFVTTNLRVYKFFRISFNDIGADINKCDLSFVIV